MITFFIWTTNEKRMKSKISVVVRRNVTYGRWRWLINQNSNLISRETLNQICETVLETENRFMLNWTFIFVIKIQPELNSLGISFEYNWIHFLWQVQVLMKTFQRQTILNTEGSDFWFFFWWKISKTRHFCSSVLPITFRSLMLRWFGNIFWDQSTNLAQVASWKQSLIFLILKILMCEG